MIKESPIKIRKVIIRGIFPREDLDFTPWLNENLDILGEKLKLDLIDSIIEESVGDFNCDIIAKDSDSNRIVIIENQYGQTDHDHLGKIFTYASGKNAKIIIWLAEEFREEHVKALEWLNENFDPQSEVSFFGVEIQVMRIGDSAPAVDLNIIVKPNDWERMIRLSSQTLSETSKKYFIFFTKLLESYSKLDPAWKRVGARPQNWSAFRTSKRGLLFDWNFKSNNRFAVGLYIDTGDQEENERIFEELKTHKAEVENALGEVHWERLDGKRACRIAIYMKTKGPIRVLEEGDYPEIIKWGTETMRKFSETFLPHIRKLKLEKTT
jgi:hypothetical protein